MLLLRSILFVCLEAILPGRVALTSVIHLVICLCFEVLNCAVSSAETYILHVLEPFLGVQESTRRFRTVSLHLEVSAVDCKNGAGRRRERGRETLQEERTRRTVGAPRPNSFCCNVYISCAMKRPVLAEVRRHECLTESSLYTLLGSDSLFAR